MKKIHKRIVIGFIALLVVIPLFWGAHYLYVIYNTEELDVYIDNCKIIKDGYIDEGRCLDDFIQKCETTGGKMISEERCFSPPPESDCLASSFASQCCFSENICKCSFGKGWNDEIGCKFL